MTRGRHDVVTARGETHDMDEQQRAPGVCLIRVQVQAASVLITVIQNPDITDRHQETTTSFAEVNDAVEAVRRFLSGFAVPAAPRSAGRS